MTPRERVLTTLSRKEPDKVPKYIRFTPEMKVKAHDKIGTHKYEDYFGIEVRRVEFKPAKKLPDFSSYYTDSLPKIPILMRVQTVMPFGTPEDVRRNVREMIDKVGQGGGFVIAPTHFVPAEVPWENVQAFFDAGEESS
jgi:hypothetical protein